MFPLLGFGLNLGDLPIGDANDMKSAPIVNKIHGSPGGGCKTETLASLLFFFFLFGRKTGRGRERERYMVYIHGGVRVEGNDVVTLPEKPQTPDRMCARNV
mgnify:CR=1 FL=1